MSTRSPFREGVTQPPADEAETWLSGMPGEPGRAEGFDFGEAEAAFEDTHPISAAFPSLPPGVFEALSHGLASVAIGLAAAAGLRDVDRLTDVVFYFRHPDRIGRPIGPGEPALAQEWIAIRDRIVRPALGPA